MEQFSQPAQNEELLNQSVSDAELKEILERIGHAEFNGTPRPTIRDISEGTSADPETIGRILGDIRKEDWEKRFGLELKDHAKRIGTLEAKQNPPPVQPVFPQQRVSAPTNYSHAAPPQHGYAAKKSQKAPAAAVVISLVVIIAIMLALFIMPFSTSVETIQSSPVRVKVQWDQNPSVSPAIKRAVEKGIRDGTIK